MPWVLPVATVGGSGLMEQETAGIRRENLGFHIDVRAGKFSFRQLVDFHPLWRIFIKKVRPGFHLHSFILVSAARTLARFLVFSYVRQ